MWLTHIVERNKQCFGDRTALVDANRSLTWAEFHDRSLCIAHSLSRRGIGQGDRVAFLSADRIDVLEVYFALARLGALFVPINHSLTTSEIADVCESTGVVAIFGESSLLNRHPVLPVDLRIAFESEEFSDLLAELSTNQFRDLPQVSDDALAAIISTSATTGRAKGVTVDYASFRAISLGWLAATQPAADTVIVNCCPLYHGSLTLSFAYMAAGATLVLVPGFKPQMVLAAIEKNRATHIWLVPQMLHFLLKTSSFSTANLSSLREILYGAAPMPAETLKHAVNQLDCGFRQVYGLTEVGGPFATLGPGEHPSSVDRTELIAAGRVIPGMSVRVLDREGIEVEPNAVGEICVRGPGIMRGYWQDAAATNEIIIRDWVHTGDLGFIDENGLITLVDRIKNIIIRAGQNIYPSEVERILNSHPKVQDSAVVGVPDADYGEVPFAYVVTEENISEVDILYHVSNYLAPYKRPRNIEFIEQIPRNAAGKIVKRLLPASKFGSTPNVQIDTAQRP
ncbi:class I adenylate-forming enzyme family protein [Rhodococcus sp. BH5]|uniref:class I adenylate-forming enzyme family protein n=1 Tax=Rhodococcus sp. BH5 TaxID=2871702 RepID=UPI0022CD975F|nr:AMP-binding protein [Rhodococcus sp. BH5]MCZ9634919.1 AMP-binding protein [Rhodococcus sp. BH5]